MSWEWSHTEEAYENARENLEKKSLNWLIVCLAEWEATSWTNPDTREGQDFGLNKYNEAYRRLDQEDVENKKAGVHRTARKADLADRIWEKAEQLRTCTNGGHEAWMCPDGCHRVDF